MLFIGSFMNLDILLGWIIFVFVVLVGILLVLESIFYSDFLLIDFECVIL